MRELIRSIRDFAQKRDWNKFHSPKNLAMALSVEVSEIVEHFQWLTEDESNRLNPEKLYKIKDEIGDVMIYLANLSDMLGIDPIEAAKEKIEKNNVKYPVEKVKGKSLKYTEYK